MMASEEGILRGFGQNVWQTRAKDAKKQMPVDYKENSVCEESQHENARLRQQVELL